MDGSCSTASTRRRHLTLSRRSRNGIAAGAIVLAASSLAIGCSSPQSAPEATETDNAAAAPKRDISGVWAGPPLPTLQPPPPLTAEGQKRFEANKPTWGPRAVGLGDSNDPLVTCDPLGFPRSMLYETR